MSVQLKDPFILEIDEWVFLGADDLYSLFDPKSFGLNPTAPNTACWKGFVVQFRVDRRKLFLDELQVFCEDNNYPPINGVTPREGEMGMQVYEEIHLPLPYSGVIVIGKDILPGESFRTFTGPYSYERTLELTFKDGYLESLKDTSGTYSRF